MSGLDLLKEDTGCSFSIECVDGPLFLLLLVTLFPHDLSPCILLAKDEFLMSSKTQLLFAFSLEWCLLDLVSPRAVT